MSSTFRLPPTRFAFAFVALALPFTLGAQGDGCSANSRSPAPDVTGEWSINYDDTIGVEIEIGGAHYEEEIPATGGTVEIVHDGIDLSFDLDCGRPDIVCPSEAWPEQISVEQRNEEYEHRMIFTLPEQQCDGTLRAPDDDECGEGTLNPDCESVCDGDIVVRETERFGVIGEEGESFRLYLGAGIATNGLNCALLAYSVADADLDTTGSSEDGDWEALSMQSGLVTIGYAGGCLWAGNVDDDPEIEALLAGASVTFRTGFTGERQ